MKKFFNVSLTLIFSTLLFLNFGCSKDSLNQELSNDLLVQENSLDSHYNNNSYSTSLKGSNEVHDVDTKATGHAKVKVAKDGSSLYYKITVGNIENVTQAHLHMEVEGENGDIVAFLYGFFPDAEGRVNGILAEGTITAEDLIGDLEGMELSTLFKAIDEGMIYVNVHTVQYPRGELRGQF